MNRHTKLAIILAPFLAIGGYIAADYYSTYEKEQVKLLPLSLNGECRLTRLDCLLTNGDLEVGLAVNKGIMTLATSHPINQAVISIVSNGQEKQPIALTQGDNAMNWATPLPNAEQHASSLTIRIFIRIAQTKYIAEVKGGLIQ